MNIKNGLICLLIALILTLCMPNDVAASACKQTTNVHSNYAMDVPVKQQPTLLLSLSKNITAVNTQVDLYGGLATSTSSGGINGIEGATINIQRLDTYDGTWYTRGTLTTMSGNFSGFFIVHITPKEPGTYIYRATFDGDINYAPAVSNVVTLTTN